MYKDSFGKSVTCFLFGRLYIIGELGAFIPLIHSFYMSVFKASGSINFHSCDVRYVDTFLPLVLN